MSRAATLHHLRQSRRRQMASNVDDEPDDVVVETSINVSCIDLTNDTAGEEIIDLTRTHGIMDNPVVVLTQSDDVGPVLRRRGSGRLGQRRRSRRGRGRRLRSGARNLATPHNEAAASSVHVLPSDDSDSDELPNVPFEVTKGASQSILASPEGVKISCPICFEDVRQIKKHHKQLMSTTCGHVFCNVCITTAIDHQKACPTCRKKLTARSVHPVFL